MFFTQYVLSKKGPLAKIWLAAHWEKKLTKAQVYETNIDRAIESILDPKIKMALRTTGHLLLGIVKIHSRKTKYLLADCNEAFLKIKMAFRPGVKPIDLSDDQADGDASSFTLPDVFRDLDSALPDLGMSAIPEELAAVQGRYEQITMKEDVPISSIEVEDDFGESSALDSFELPRDATGGAGGGLDFVSATGITLEEKRLDRVRTEGGILDIDSPLLDDGFGGRLSDHGFDGGLDLFDPLAFDASLSAAADNGDEMDTAALPNAAMMGASASPTSAVTYSKQMSTLLFNDEEAFVLEPVDATVNRTNERHRVKRKRRLLVDTVKNIPGDDFKAQLSYDKDTISRLEIAPFTKALLKMRETGSFDKLWNSPGLPYKSSALSSMYCKIIAAPATMTKEQYLREQDDADLEMIRAGDESSYSVIDNDLRVTAALPPIQEESYGMGAQTLPDVNSLEEGNNASIESPTVSQSSTPRKAKRAASFRRTPSSRSNLSEDSGERSLRWTRKSQQLLNQINNKLKSADEVTFKAITKGNDRKTAAQKFYSLLELQKWNAVSVSQDAPFSEIRIFSGRPDA